MYAPYQNWKGIVFTCSMRTSLKGKRYVKERLKCSTKFLLLFSYTFLIQLVFQGTNSRVQLLGWMPSFPAYSYTITMFWHGQWLNKLQANETMKAFLIHEPTYNFINSAGRFIPGCYTLAVSEELPEEYQVSYGICKNPTDLAVCLEISLLSTLVWHFITHAGYLFW